MKKNLILFIVLLALGAVAFFAWKRNSTSTLAGEPLSQFAIEDTASITKIFITDTKERAVTLEKTPGSRLWKLNDKYWAKHEPVQLLLKTFNRMKARSSVMTTAKENVIKMITAAGKKVEVYQNGSDKPSKIYYVGTATPEHTGTYMVLEIPGQGMSPEPYIVVMEGFTGFLSTRFHAEEDDWRYTGVFEYPDLEFSELRVTFHNQPANSFSVKYGGGNDLMLMDGTDKIIPQYDTIALKNYLLNYKKIHFETFNSYLTALQEDSLLKTSPLVSLSVLNEAGEQKQIELYWKRATKDVWDEGGNLVPQDLEYFFGVVEPRDVVLCQRFVFDPLVVGLGEFAE
ncbi:MAG: hypothetical protein SH856_12925 [Flavobacteriales bacterium]|nr:hypothetical protein [Flavobacteriales bacterium]